MFWLISHKDFYVFRPDSVTYIVYIHDLRKQSRRIENVLADIKPPIHGDKRLSIAYRITVILFGLNVLNTAVAHYCPRLGCGHPIHQWHRKDVHSPRLEGSSDFPEHIRGIEDVLKDVLGYMQVNAFVTKRQAPQIFIAYFSN
ncbi:MAG: hypothetical protein WA632_04735 [Gallionella sp.]